MGQQTNILNGLNTNLGALLDKVNALGDAVGPLTTSVATSSHPELLAAAAQSSAAVGNHSIVVTRLATASIEYTDPIPSGNTLTQGTQFTLKVGAGTPTAITVDKANETLGDLATSINGKNLGVTANVINDSQGQRLSLVTSATGLASQIIISGNGTGLTFNSIAGNDASLSVDGIPVLSASNTVTGVVPGVTITLNAASAGTTVALSVGPDTSAASQAVNDFVTAYNAVVTGINQQFSFNPATNSAGALAGDSGLRSLQTSLLTDATYALSGSNAYNSLASLGIAMQDDGTLTVDNSQLGAALSGNLGAVQNFFRTTSQDGFANKFSQDLTNLSDPTQGVLSLEITQNAVQQTDLANRITDFEGRLAEQQTQLVAKYSQVNTLLQQYPFLLQQVQQQLAALPTS